MSSLQPENDPDKELNDSGSIHDDSITDKYSGQAELLDLSDDVLLYILKFCTPRDLKALGHTCPRLGALICDHTLWQKVDARSDPTGQERLSWLLTHCLTPGTQELKLTGYVNRDTRCLGIQDLTWPLGGENGGAANSVPGVDVEHFLLRMWYSHLPRYAMSPRWPDKREAAGKAYSSSSKGPKQPLSPLSQLASEIVAGAGQSTSSISDLSNSSRNSSNSERNSSNSDRNSSNSGPSTSSTSNSGTSPSSSGTSSDNGPDSSTSGAHSSNSGTESSDTAFSTDPLDNIAASCQGPQFTLNRSLLKSLRTKCRNLSSLSLEYCNLDYRNANLRYFPPKLKKLSLKGTRCYNLPLSTSYLGKIQDRLPELEVLDISECEWFEPASLLPLSKVRNLQELYIRDCRRLTECVAYASLATRYGFQKLRILDLRGSPVADSEVSALGWLPLLEELYVSPPDDMKIPSEHSHKWDDVLAPFTELDSWETEEPDYYSCKSPHTDPNEDAEDTKEDGEPSVADERLGDVMIGNYITCASLERRIIVIHPNRQYQNENRDNDQPPPGVGHNPPERDPGPAADPDPGPGPSRRPAKRIRAYHCLDLVKRKFGEARPEQIEGDQAEGLLESRPEDQSSKTDEEVKQENNDPKEPVPSTSKLEDQTSQSEDQESSTSKLVDPEPPASKLVDPEPPASKLVDSELPTSKLVDSEPPTSKLVDSELPTSKLVDSEPPTSKLVDQEPTTSKLVDENSGSSKPESESKSKPKFDGIRSAFAAVPSTSKQEDQNSERSSNTETDSPKSNQFSDSPSTSKASHPTKRPGESNQSSDSPSTSKGPHPTKRPREDPPNPANSGTKRSFRIGSTEVHVREIVIPERRDPDNPQNPLDNAQLSPEMAIRPYLSRYFDRLAANNMVGPPMAVHARPVRERPHAEGGVNAFICDYAEPVQRRGCVLRSRGYVQRNIPRDLLHFGHHLVSDSSVLRFGRAVNDNINYIHIGHNFHANDPGVRPDRSNLRVLSVTGYRNITDRSLQHLATAAPNLRVIDFSRSGVTDRGVEVFRAIRPNCQVVFSRFGRDT